MVLMERFGLLSAEVGCSPEAALPGRADPLGPLAVDVAPALPDLEPIRKLIM